MDLHSSGHGHLLGTQSQVQLLRSTCSESSVRQGTVHPLLQRSTDVKDRFPESVRKHEDRLRNLWLLTSVRFRDLVKEFYTRRWENPLSGEIYKSTKTHQVQNTRFPWLCYKCIIRRNLRYLSEFVIFEGLSIFPHYGKKEEGPF